LRIGKSVTDMLPVSAAAAWARAIQIQTQARHKNESAAPNEEIGMRSQDSMLKQTYGAC
jgi:hypothetical protein